MRRPFHIAVVAVMLAACNVAGCSSDSDPVTSVDSGDAEMNAAIAKARDSLPRFWSTFEKPEHAESDFALKVKLTDANGTEHFWLSDLERKDGKIMGTVNNDAVTVRSVKLGDRIPIPEASISDWMYMRDGKMVGNYTVRALFKTMSPAEVENIKKMLAEP
jgi:uncharacterized protein YegJ (DUF2314 family)